MDHNLIKLDDESDIQNLVINQKDNNLDELDNLDELPSAPAVFMVCGRVNGEPANPRYVGEADNLQSVIKGFFDKSTPAPEGNDCFKEFMLSIKTKELVYQLLTDVSKEGRETKRIVWSDKYQPKCNEALNEIH